jgi:hypothetical protein
VTVCGKGMEYEIVPATSQLLQLNVVHSGVSSEVVHHVKSHGLLVVTNTIRARGVECPLRDMRLSEPSCEKYLHIGGTATLKQRHGHCAWIHQSVVKRCSDDRRDSISTRASATQKGRPGLIFAILTREN